MSCTHWQLHCHQADRVTVYRQHAPECDRLGPERTIVYMKTSWHGNIFRITASFWGESTGDRRQWLGTEQATTIIWTSEDLFNTHIIHQAISLTNDDAKTFDELTNSWTKWPLFCRSIAIPLYKISVNFTRFLYPRERTSVKFKLKCKFFLSRKFIWKCRLQNGDHVVSASMCYHRYFPPTSFGGV